MNVQQAKLSFEQLLASGGHSVESLGVERGVRLMLDFYRNQRCEGCSIDNDGDMLLYQWGVTGSEGLFEIDLTRQFIVGEDSDDENIWQLSLTCQFSPTSELQAISSGNKWCSKPKPQAVDYFEKFIRDSATYRSVVDLQPTAVLLNFDNAG
ncbi:MAG: hypothetical protein KF688_07825 [Pirellulales bacterium]|nr:hypothetical protein [Pirellulales bacterium]